MDLPTRLDHFALGRQYVRTRNPRIDPAVIDIEGSDANIVVGSTSVVAQSIVNQLAYSTAKNTLDGSFDDDLDRYVWDKYQELRKGAAAALGAVRMSRPNAALGSGSIPAGTVILSIGSVQYITTQVATFGASQTDNVLSTVRAVQAGKASQVTANQLTRFERPADLFDRSILVTNDLATAGGEDSESDDDFKNRVRQFWITASRGILSAIERGALSVPGVVSAIAVEALTPTAQPARVVNLYIADSSGVASAALAALVAVALNEYRAGGIGVIIFTSIPTAVDIVLKLSFATGVATAELSQAVLGAVVAFVNSIPVNGALEIGALFAVLKRYAPDGLLTPQSSIVSPVGDVIPPIGQTIRITASNVTLT